MRDTIHIKQLMDRMAQQLTGRTMSVQAIAQDRGRFLELCHLIDEASTRRNQGVDYNYILARREMARREANRKFCGEAQGRQMEAEALLEDLKHSTDVLDGDPGGTGVLTPKEA